MKAESVTVSAKHFQFKLLTLSFSGKIIAEIKRNAGRGQQMVKPESSAVPCLAD